MGKTPFSGRLPQWLSSACHLQRNVLMNLEPVLSCPWCGTPGQCDPPPRGSADGEQWFRCAYCYRRFCVEVPVEAPPPRMDGPQSSEHLYIDRPDEGRERPALAQSGSGTMWVPRARPS